MRINSVVVLVASLCLLLSVQAFAADGPAPMTLDVDATDFPRKIIHARLVIPAGPGPLKLFYPKWIPGEHGPTGPINDLAGIQIKAGGKAIPWKRDDLDMYAIGCDVPAGADSVEVSLDFLFSGGKGFSGGVSATE